MSFSARIDYACVSSVDQPLDRQLAQFKEQGIEKVFTDKVSCKNTDRMARNLKDLPSITEMHQNKGVSVHFLKENISLVPTGEKSALTKLLMAMIGAVAEFERSLILERQREGIEQAKKINVYKGRVPIDQETIEKARQMVNDGMSKVVVAKKLGIGRTTLYKYLNTESTDKE